MKVAIIGAGISGLSAALEFERNGIEPVIFEKRSRVGEATGNTALWMPILDARKEDFVNYFKTKYNIEIKPLSRLKKVVMISPNNETAVKSEMGYLLRRGVEQDSIENQIYSHIKSKINFDTYINIEDVKDKYDYVIVATSNTIIPKKMKVWTDTFICQARITKVIGKFEPECAYLWFNEKYSNMAFVYLIPNNSKEASLVLLVNNQAASELDYYWNKFIQAENIQYHVIEINDIEHYCGFVKPYVVENIYFVGNAAGFTDDLIGIGIANAIESGILAARSIINGEDYNKVIQPIHKDIVKLHEFRKAMNSFDNANFDSFVSVVGIPGIKQFIYNNPKFKVQDWSQLARVYNEFNEWMNTI